MLKRTNEVISNLVIWRIYDAGASLANKPAANGTEIASARMLYLQVCQKLFNQEQKRTKRTGMMVSGWPSLPVIEHPLEGIKHVSN